MARQIAEHRLALGLAVLAVAFAEKGLLTRLVQIVAKVKAARLAAREPALAAADPSRYTRLAPFIMALVRHG